MLMPFKSKIFPRRLVGTVFGSKSSVADYKKKQTRERRSQERGSHRRMPVQFFDPKQRRCHHGILINGSDGGAFIETNDTLPLLTEIRIEGPGIAFQAQICRVHWLGPEERGTRSGGMAVRLLGSTQFEDADYETDSGIVLSIANHSG